MFPESFAERWITHCSRPGDVVLDPFSGRGTAAFQALLMDRNAIANDANPVAFVLSGAKIDSPTLGSITRRMSEIEKRFSSSIFQGDESELPPFFSRAFHKDTLTQLIFIRQILDWKSSRVDRFIAALVLGSLHGEMDKSKAYFSNQMPRTISTKPNYSIRFWDKHDLWPQPRDVFRIIRDRAAFRFESPRPNIRGVAYLADVRGLPFKVPHAHGSVNLVITSPPYMDVTNFEEDQWLRLWFLGGPPRPTTGLHSTDDRHERPDKYWAFLCDAWRAIRPLLCDRSTLVCRIGGRNVSANQIQEALCASMQFLARRATLVEREVSYLSKRRQTDAFRPGTVGVRFESDFHFKLQQ